MEQTVYERNAELLARARGGDTAAEEQLMVANMGLVRSIAGRFLDRGTEYEDLVQIGSIGMLKAIRSFSPEHGTVFSTYAVPLIVGEIRRHLRDDGPLKVSRIYKKQGMTLLHEKNKILAEEEKMEAASKKNGGLLLYFVNREYATLITGEGKSVSVKCFENGKALCYGYSSATKMNESGWGDGIPEEGELEGYYYVDYDFENYEKVDATDVKSQDFSFVMNEGFLKSVAVRDENNNYIGRQYILADNDGNEKLYFDFTADTGDLYGGVSYIDENYFYFQKTGAENQVKVGVSKTYSGISGDVFNMNGGKLYRYNRKTGEIECIIDDPNYQIGAILYASEETGRFVCYCTVFTKESDGTVSSHSDVLCSGELHNGVLSDFKPYAELYNPGSSDFPF